MAGTFLYRSKSILKNSNDPRFQALFDKKSASNIWRDSKLFPSDQYEAYFEIMSKFELVYWMENVSRYLVPSLLSEGDSSFVSKDSALLSKKRTFRFSSILPIGLFYRLLIQILHLYLSGGDAFTDYLPWKHGLVLTWNQGLVSIEESELELHLSAKGRSLTWIDKKLSEILSIAKSLIDDNFPGIFLVIQISFEKVAKYFI
jgi:hypothetical protein